MTANDVILAEVYRELEWVKWVGRVLKWRGAYFVRNRPHYCLICKRISYCRRLQSNQMIQNMILKGEVCPDVWTIWNEVFER